MRAVRASECCLRVAYPGTARDDETRDVLGDRETIAADPKPPGNGAADHAPTMGLQMPARVGPYKLLERLGEGGMGVVFLAEQESPVRRRVALKVIKPGMDSAL